MSRRQSHFSAAPPSFAIVICLSAPPTIISSSAAVPPYQYVPPRLLSLPQSALPTSHLHRVISAPRSPRQRPRQPRGTSLPSLARLPCPLSTTAALSLPFGLPTTTLHLQPDASSHPPHHPFTAAARPPVHQSAQRLDSRRLVRTPSAMLCIARRRQCIAHRATRRAATAATPPQRASTCRGTRQRWASGRTSIWRVSSIVSLKSWIALAASRVVEKRTVPQPRERPSPSIITSAWITLPAARK